MTYTIYVAEQKRETPMTAIPNCAGQMIAFDGPCTKEEALHLARVYADSWAKVQVFKGKSVGRLIAEFPDKGANTL